MVLVREDVGGLVVRVGGEPGLVAGEVDGDANLLGVVEHAGVGGHVEEGGLGVVVCWVAEDGVEAGLWRTFQYICLQYIQYGIHIYICVCVCVCVCEQV